MGSRIDFLSVLDEVRKLQENLRTEYELATSELDVQLRGLRQENQKLVAQLSAFAVEGHCYHGVDLGVKPWLEAVMPQRTHPNDNNDGEGFLKYQCHPTYGTASGRGQLDGEARGEHAGESADAAAEVAAGGDVHGKGLARGGSSDDVNNIASHLSTSDEDVAAARRREKRNVEEVARKLRIRLGQLDEDDMISDATLYQAISALGLTKYDKAAIRSLIVQLKAVYHGRRKRFRSSPSASINAGLLQSWWSSLTLAVSRKSENDADAKTKFRKRSFSRLAQHHAAEHQIPFMHFVELLVDRDSWCSLSTYFETAFRTMAEVLLSGDTNRLVAELTNTLINDLAAPPPRLDLLTALEPCACFLIILNGVMIGVQADRDLESWVGWWYMEFAFVLLFCMELVIRVGITGAREHFCGSDAAWNNFDVAIILFAILDLLVQVTGLELPGYGASTVLRLFRLTRLSRMLRMLRFQMFRELTLMLKGLMGGLRTLGWAMVLLMTAIYAIAVLLTSILGGDIELRDLLPDADEYFATVPRAMFTAFRCLTGDCADSAGRSLVVLLSSAFGIQFALPYVLLVMVVTFGIFNLIMAIYVESTMSAAKRQDEADKRLNKRECLRVAYAVKELIRSFRAAQIRFGKLQDADVLDDIDFEDDFDDSSIIISRDLFLYSIQDRKVQLLMDDLDIQSDRAHLFDVLDARGDGRMPLLNLMEGLLKVRGEANKSDMVACLMAIRSLQEQLQGPPIEEPQGNSKPRCARSGSRVGLAPPGIKSAPSQRALHSGASANMSAAARHADLPVKPRGSELGSCSELGSSPELASSSESVGRHPIFCAL